MNKIKICVECSLCSTQIFKIGVFAKIYVCISSSKAREMIILSFQLKGFPQLQVSVCLSFSFSFKFQLHLHQWPTCNDDLSGSGLWIGWPSLCILF